MSDYLFNVVNKILGLASGLIVAVILARSLSVELRGEFGFIVSVASLAAIVSGLGVSHYFIYKSRKEQNTATFNSAVFLLLGQALGLSVLTLAVTLATRSQTAGLVLALTTSLMLHQQLGAIMAAYDIRRRIRVSLLYSIARLAVFSTLLLVVSEELWLLVALASLAPLCAVAVHLSVVPWGRFERPAEHFAREAYRFGWLPMITTLLVVLNYNVDIVMLRALGSGLDLGLYVVAAGVVTYMWMIPDAIKEVLVSRVIRTKDIRVVLLPLKVAVLASLVAVATMAVAGPLLIPLAFGSAYRDAYSLILILSFGTPPLVYYKILGVPVLAEGLRAAYCVSLGVAATLNVLLNLWAIPRYGAAGAATVSAVTYSVTGAAFVKVFCSAFKVPLREVLIFNQEDRLAARTLLRGNAT